jgi:hypothetical protein
LPVKVIENGSDLKQETIMSAAQNRLERLERVAELLTRHTQYEVVRWAAKHYNVGLGQARKYLADAKTLMQSRYQPEELDRLKAYVSENLITALGKAQPKEKAAIAKVLCNMFGFNAPVQFEVKTPPLYDGPGITDLNASTNSD